MVLNTQFVFRLRGITTVLHDCYVTAQMYARIIVTNEEEKYVTIGRREKGLNPCEQHVPQHGNAARPLYITISVAALPEVAGRGHGATLSINVGRSPGNPFTFRTPPGHSAGTFSREKRGKLRKDNGSCPMELPSVRGAFDVDGE